MRHVPARHRLSLLAIVAVLAGVWVPGAGAASTPPDPVPLNAERWTFARDDGDRGLRDGWRDGRFSGSQATLPHVTDLRMDETGYRGTVGWYRARIRAPRTGGDFSWALSFEQVRRIADVWIDGRHVGRHVGSYEPFEMPAGALDDGAEHTIVIRADNRLEPKRRTDGWWNWGGVTRGLTLVPHGALALRDSGFMPERVCPQAGGRCSWNVIVDTTVVNHGTRLLTPRLTAALAAPDGTAAGIDRSSARPLAPGESARVRFRVALDGLERLWSPAHPALYLTSLTLHALETGSDDVLAATGARVGLRTVRVRDGLLYLNGRPVELRGASVHEDMPGHGPALTSADIDDYVESLRAIGANVTRAHYSLDHRLLDRLDQAGILVWAQAPVYHRDNELETDAQRERELRVVRAATIQTRSHPSVITHSVANELSTHPDERAGTRLFLEAARAQTRDLDPTLPVSVDMLSYPNMSRQETYARFDMLGLNTYFGWYPGREGHSTAELASLVPFVKQMRSWYPDAALVMTEFGAEATMTGPRDEKQTYAFQSRYIEQTLDTAGRLPALSGAIYWSLREFAVKPRWDGGAQTVPARRDSYHHKGVLTHDGRRKPAWETLREEIATTPLLRSDGSVLRATGIALPSSDQGRLGIGAMGAILFALLVLIAVDLWAFADWRRHAHADEDDLLTGTPVPALALAPGVGAEPAGAERVA